MVGRFDIGGWGEAIGTSLLCKAIESLKHSGEVQDAKKKKDTRASGGSVEGFGSVVNTTFGSLWPNSGFLLIPIMGGSGDGWSR